MDLSFLIECSAMAVAIRVVIHVSRLADVSQLVVASQLVVVSQLADVSQLVVASQLVMMVAATAVAVVVKSMIYSVA